MGAWQGDIERSWDALMPTGCHWPIWKWTKMIKNACLIMFAQFHQVRTRTSLHSSWLRSVLPLPSWQVDRQPKNWWHSSPFVHAGTVHAICLNATHPQSSRMIFKPAAAAKCSWCFDKSSIARCAWGTLPLFLVHSKWTTEQMQTTSNNGYILQPISIRCMALEFKLTCFHHTWSLSPQSWVSIFIWHPWLKIVLCHLPIETLSKSIRADMLGKILALPKTSQNADSSG